MLLRPRAPTRAAALLAAVAGGAALGCGTAQDIVGPAGPAPARDASPVQTDAVTYRLRKVSGGYDAYAAATYVNGTGAPVRYARCGVGADGPLYGLRRTGPDSTARSFIGGAWACVGGAPTGVVAPGDSLTVHVWLGSTDSPNANPPIAAAERAGRFRVELELCAAPVASSDDCRPRAQAERQSNAFDVRLE